MSAWRLIFVAAFALSGCASVPLNMYAKCDDSGQFLATVMMTQAEWTERNNCLYMPVDDRELSFIESIDGITVKLGCEDTNMDNCPDTLRPWTVDSAVPGL